VIKGHKGFTLGTTPETTKQMKRKPAEKKESGTRSDRGSDHETNHQGRFPRRITPVSLDIEGVGGRTVFHTK